MAALATLILLSYAMFLHTVITTLSYATLVYPEGPRSVWLPDAKVEYLSGRRIPLFIVVIIILLIGTAYTFLLFSWQWLLIIKWIQKYHRLNHFIETYHAPYKVEHRYWTGLLLLVRAVLYLVFVTGYKSLHLLAITATTCGLLFLKGQFGKIYNESKSWVVDAIEMVSYLNTALFSAAKFFTLTTEQYENVIAASSVSITFLILILILAYHIHTEISLKLWKRLKLMRSRKGRNTMVDNPPTDSGVARPTYSTVDVVPSRQGSPLIWHRTDKTKK